MATNGEKFKEMFGFECRDGICNKEWLNAEWKGAGEDVQQGELAEDSFIADRDDNELVMKSDVLNALYRESYVAYFPNVTKRVIDWNDAKRAVSGLMPSDVCCTGMVENLEVE